MANQKWPETRWTVREVAEGLGVPVAAVWDWIQAGQLTPMKGELTDSALHTFLWRYPLAGRSRARNVAWVDGLLWGCDLYRLEPPDVRAARQAAKAARKQEARFGE
jgi:hypothetical protein